MKWMNWILINYHSEILIRASSFGWESAFYATGAITFAWFAFWWLLVFDTPETHPRISPEEKARNVGKLPHTKSSLGCANPWQRELSHAI